MSIEIDYPLGITGLSLTATAYISTGGDAAGVSLTFNENVYRLGYYSVTTSALSAGLYWISISGGIVDSQWVTIPASGTVTLLASGFEAVGWPSIDITAPVAVESFTADGLAALQAAFANRTINVVSPLVLTCDNLPTFIVVTGDDYMQVDGRQLAFPTFTGTFPDWTGAVATVEFGTLTITAVITTATGSTRNVYFELTAANSLLLAAPTTAANNSVLFDLVVTLANGHRTTVINEGVLTLLANV